jgi:membrane protein
VVTLGIILLIVLALGVFIAGNIFSGHIMNEKWVNKKAVKFFFKIIQFATLSTLIFFIMSFVYYFAHSAKKRWKFFSPGAIVATILSIAATYLFSNYVDGFDSYNRLYGSIGAIIVLMLLIYFNTLCVLVGFELNMSIDTVVKITQEKRKLENRFIN